MFLLARACILLLGVPILTLLLLTHPCLSPDDAWSSNLKPGFIHLNWAGSVHAAHGMVPAARASTGSAPRRTLRVLADSRSSGPFVGISQGCDNDATVT